MSVKPADTGRSGFSETQIQNMQADLTQESDVQRMFAEANRAFIPVQVVIANHEHWPGERPGRAHDARPMGRDDVHGANVAVLRHPV